MMMHWYTMLLIGIGFRIGSPLTFTVWPLPRPGPTCSTLSCVCTWYVPGSSAFTVIEYGTVAPAGMSKMFPGGSLARNSHLLPAFSDSLNRESQPLSSLLTKLFISPVTVSSSPVVKVLSENCSLSILMNLDWQLCLHTVRVSARQVGYYGGQHHDCCKSRYDQSLALHHIPLS